MLTLPASRQWYKNFVLPWADVPTSVRAKLNSHTRIAPKERRGVVRTFMDSILNVCASPRKSELAAVDEIAEAVENDRKRAMLPGIVLMIMAFFMECVEYFFEVAEVIHITY